MATVIRLKRGGRAHQPYYRVVVVDQRKRATGRVIEELGVYHPCAKPEPRMEVDAGRALHWMYEGAKPSDTARNVLKKEGVLQAFALKRTPEDVAAEQKAKREELSAKAQEAAASSVYVPQDRPLPKEEPKQEAPKAEEAPAEAQASEGEASAPAEGEAPAEAAAEAPAGDAPAEEAAGEKAE